MPDITIIKPHPLKGRPSPVEGQHYLDKRAQRLIADGTSNGAAPDDLMTTIEIAAWLGMSRQWLEIGRHRGYGPPFVQLHRRIKYRRADVLAWLETRRHRSTAEYRQQHSHKQPGATRQPVLIGRGGLKRFAPLPDEAGKRAS